MGLSSGRGQQGQRARLHGDRIRAKGACRSTGPGPMAACSRERGPARPSCPNQGREALRERAVGQAPWWSKALRHQNQYSGALQGHMAHLHGASLRAEGPCNSRGPGPVARKRREGSPQRPAGQTLGDTESGLRSPARAQAQAPWRPAQGKEVLQEQRTKSRNTQIRGKRALQDQTIQLNGALISAKRPFRSIGPGAMALE